MKSFKCFYTLGTCLCLLTTTARHPSANQSPAPGTFGMMRYTAPAGWTEQKFSDGVVFKPADLPSSEHLSIQIMQPVNAAGTLEEALAKSFDEAAAMYKATKMQQSGGNYGTTGPQRSFNGWEYIRGKGAFRSKTALSSGLNCLSFESTTALSGSLFRNQGNIVAASRDTTYPTGSATEMALRTSCTPSNSPILLRRL